MSSIGGAYGYSLSNTNQEITPNDNQSNSLDKSNKSSTYLTYVQGDNQYIPSFKKTDSSVNTSQFSYSPSSPINYDSETKPLPDTTMLTGKRIGHGGQGSVYIARFPGIDKKYVVKLFNNPSHLDNEVVANLKLPLNENIVRCFGVANVANPSGFTQKGLVFEYIEGGMPLAKTLHVLRQARTCNAISEADFSNWTHYVAKQLIQAIRQLHSAGVVHRDIKPDNVLIDLNGNVKICDFGLANADANDSQATIDLTLTDKGTHGYKPPEHYSIRQNSVLDGETQQSIDQKTDVFALGLVLFPLLTDPIQAEQAISQGQQPLSPELVYPLPHTPFERFSLATKLVHLLESYTSNPNKSQQEIRERYETELDKTLGKLGANNAEIINLIRQMVQLRPKLRQSLLSSNPIPPQFLNQTAPPARVSNILKTNFDQQKTQAFDIQSMDAQFIETDPGAPNNQFSPYAPPHRPWKSE